MSCWGARVVERGRAAFVDGHLVGCAGRPHSQTRLPCSSPTPPEQCCSCIAAMVTGHALAQGHDGKVVGSCAPASLKREGLACAWPLCA